MTLYELIQNHEFDSIVPHLTAIDPENVPGNLYAFKEAFDDLRRISPGDAGSEQIVVSTHVDTDEGWAKYHRREARRNRQDGVLMLNPAAEQIAPKRFHYLFDSAEISTPEFYSRTVLKDGRAAYISQNIVNYYIADSTEYTKAIVLIETSDEQPLRLSEFKPLQASLGRITSQ